MFTLLTIALLPLGTKSEECAGKKDSWSTCNADTDCSQGVYIKFCAKTCCEQTKSDNCGGFDGCGDCVTAMNENNKRICDWVEGTCKAVENPDTASWKDMEVGSSFNCPAATELGVAEAVCPPAETCRKCRSYETCSGKSMVTTYNEEECSLLWGVHCMCPKINTVVDSCEQTEDSEAAVGEVVCNNVNINGMGCGECYGQAGAACKAKKFAVVGGTPEWWKSFGQLLVAVVAGTVSIPQGILIEGTCTGSDAEWRKYVCKTAGGTQLGWVPQLEKSVGAEAGVGESSEESFSSSVAAEESLFFSSSVFLRTVSVDEFALYGFAALGFGTMLYGAGQFYLAKDDNEYSKV